MYYTKKQNSGFTLIEIIVTVIIVGILMAIAIPNLLGLYNQYQVKNALNQVESSVKEAQRQAMRRGKACKIKFDETTVRGKVRDRITVVINSDPGERGKDYSSCLTRDRILPEAVDLVTNIPGSIHKMSFSHKGNTPTSGTIKVSVQGLDIGKCLVISNGLGIIRTGNYQPSGSGSMAKKCKKQV